MHCIENLLLVKKKRRTKAENFFAYKESESDIEGLNPNEYIIED